MTAEEQLQRLAASSKAYKEEAEKEIERLKSLVAKLGRENEMMKYNLHADGLARR